MRRAKYNKYWRFETHLEETTSLTEMAFSIVFSYKIAANHILEIFNALNALNIKSL